MRYILSCFLSLVVATVFSQEEIVEKETPKIKIDSLYREDQFYLGFSYNSLINKPHELSQNKLSTGVSLGFLRDFPVNKMRTIAFAPGIGLTYANYIQNLAIRRDNGTVTYSILNNSIAYKTNDFSQVFVDVPMEFRWRNSTFQSHKFWRVYTGLKLSYLIYDKATYDNEDIKTTVSNNPDYNNFTYGVYLSAGYNTWNINIYYGLNSLFKSANIDDQVIRMKTLNFGIMFYIL
jgi:hypothetical protein